MNIEEHPEIRRNGEVVSPKTSMDEIVHSFTTQLSYRGTEAFVYHVDKDQEEKQEEAYEEYMNSDETEMPEGIMDVFPCGFSWSEDFNNDSMLEMIMMYLNVTTDSTGKLAFVTQLHNLMLNDIVAGGGVDSSPVVEDEDED